MSHPLRKIKGNIKLFSPAVTYTVRQKNAAVKLPRHFYLFVSLLISVSKEAEEIEEQVDKVEIEGQRSESGETTV